MAQHGRTRTRGARGAPALALALAAFLLAPPPAGADPGRLNAVRERLRAQVLDLAEVCASRKLFGTRHDLYDFVIQNWPDDEVARRWNGYERGPDGDWLPSKKKRPRNMSVSGLPALREMQARIADEYVAAVLEAVHDEPAERVAAHRGRAIRDAVTIAPDHETVRALNGEVRGKGSGGREGWILVETARSRERRPFLRQAAAEALRGIPAPEKGTPRARDEHSSVTWTQCFQGPRGRIVGLPDAEEVKQTLVNGQAAFPFFAAAFGVEPPTWPGLTFYSFDTPSRGNVWLAVQPEVTQAWLKFVAPLAALWIPKSDRVVIKSPEPEVRLEAAPRQVFGGFLSSLYGVSGRQGWIVEGFGLYLTWQVTGTRLLYSVRQSQYGEQPDAIPDLGKRMREHKTDWLKEARTLLDGRNPPDLRLLLGKTVNTMTNEDVLYSYVLAVFLVEGRQEVLPDLLRGFGQAKEADFDVVLGEHLGLDVPTLERRVKRWMDETKDLK